MKHNFFLFINAFSSSDPTTISFTLSNVSNMFVSITDAKWVKNLWYVWNAPSQHSHYHISVKLLLLISWYIKMTWKSNRLIKKIETRLLRKKRLVKYIFRKSQGFTIPNFISKIEDKKYEVFMYALLWLTFQINVIPA
jgi:hypothetical protein